MLNKTYKFYLSFENSVCRDYITEKFFQRILASVVPIVLRRSDYIGKAPENSFIAVDDFESPKELAQYLYYLDRNNTAYFEYFLWREKFESYYFNEADYACKLCEKLHDPFLPDSKVYDDVHTWWHTDGQCVHQYGRIRARKIGKEQ